MNNKITYVIFAVSMLLIPYFIKTGEKRRLPLQALEWFSQSDNGEMNRMLTRDCFFSSNCS